MKPLYDDHTSTIQALQEQPAGPAAPPDQRAP